MKDQAKLIEAIRARGSDADNLRDAAHEAHHALFVGLRGKWERERIHQALLKRARYHPAELVSYELDARAVEWTICDRFGVSYEAEKWADLMWWETIKSVRISLPTGPWVLDAMTRRKGDPFVEVYTNRVEALARARRTRKRAA